MPLDTHFLLALDGDTEEGQDGPVVPATTTHKTAWRSRPYEAAAQPSSTPPITVQASFVYGHLMHIAVQFATASEQGTRVSATVNKWPALVAAPPSALRE